MNCLKLKPIALKIRKFDNFGIVVAMNETKKIHRMKYFGLLTLLLITNALFAQDQKMSASEIAQFKATTEKGTKTIKTVKTDFTQYKHLAFLENDIESSGKMMFKSPSSLNWKYISPYQYSILFKNNKIYINDQGNKSTVNASNSKMFERINKLIVGTVSGNMFDDKEFTIEYYKNKDFNIAKLTPKEAALKKYIKQVYLYFPPNESVVSKVKLIEPSDDYTLIIFKNKIINAAIDDALFSN